MKKFHKIILVFILIIFTLFNSIIFFKSFAQNKKSNFLSLKQAQEEAIKNSSILKEDMRNLKSLEDDYSQIRRQEKKIKDYMKQNDWDVSLEDYKYKYGYKTKEIDMKIKCNKLKLKKDEEQIKLDVLLAYQDVLLKQKELEIEKENIKYQKILLDIKKFQSELGKISLNEFEKTENDYNNFILSLKSKQQELENSYVKLNILRGVSLKERPILSVDTINISSLDTVLNQEEAFKKALESRYDILSLKNDIEFLKMDIENISIKYTPNTYEYKKRERMLNNAKEKYEDKKNEIKKEIESIYSELLISKLRNDNIKSSLETIKEDLKKKNILYKYGRISKIELDNLKIEILKKKLEYISNVFEYDRLLNKYIFSYTFGS
ncbi:TolC family protein [Tepidibacter thalassicus]|uniref:Outer membrane efflux protein n=1 Tax=Tepidibacter thalassicus DSM 15285 TaxID=1123350 RepID=A0A1M5P2L6_9FIRM|nr:TolC family protein [Tepidibacter thalassicus]SHG95957.1 Outer membrane efflux protein [Tepidibacter thalassicus DSM 15285]